MKTFNWTQIRKFISFIALALMVVSTMACGKKDNKAAPVSRQNRGVGYNQQNIDPRTGQASTEWGAIYNFQDQELRKFMNGVYDLGSVSSNMNADTGVRFRTNKQTRAIEMLVWDDVASQQGENFGMAYFWSLAIVSQQGGVVVVEDNMGRVTFNGSIQNGEWRGYISFENSAEAGGERGNLGSFAISANESFN